MKKNNDLSQKNRKAPIISIIKRNNLSTKSKASMYLCGILIAFVISAIFIASMKVNPFVYFGKVIAGCFKNTINLRGLIRIVSPLIITSLGVAVAFKMKFWNIGAEGQFIMGAICASLVGLSCAKLPQFLALLLMFISAIVGGGMYALITAFFKVKFGTNETLLTLMFNYLALYFLSFLKFNVPYFQDPSAGRPTFIKLPQSAWLYEIKFSPKFGFDIAIIIALLLTAFIFIYFKYTKHGYEISIIGDSLNTARYAGMKVNKVILRTIFLSGAIIGFAGMLQVSGEASSHVLSDNITGGVGWTAIIVAWLSKLNPLGIVLTSVLLGILQKGSSVAASSFGISSSIADIIQGIILFIVLSCDFFIRYKVVINKNQQKSKVKEETV